MIRIASGIGLVAVGAVAVVLASVGPALASAAGVPEPSSLTLLSAGIAAVALGARWLRRK